MADETAAPEIAMDAASLYREETFTDRRIGTIQRLTPVNEDGADDDSRPIKFIGQTQIMTPGGALPLSFEIDASSLDEAVSQFGATATAALNETMQKLEEMRREAASSLIVPGAESPVGVPPGTGGIQIP